MKYKYRQSEHKEYVGDEHGNLYLNHLKYFEFHSYPGERLHRFWAVSCMILLLFKIDDLFDFHFMYGLLGIYIFYVAIFTHFLLIKKICRHKGYFLYPSFFIKFFKKRRKSVDSQSRPL